MTMPKRVRGVSAGMAFMLMVACGSATRVERDQKQAEGPLRHFQLARMYYEQGKVQESLQELDQSFKLDNKLPQVHAYLGYVRLEQEQWAEAAKAYHEAIKLNPYYTDARQHLAVCLQELGDIPGALEQLEQASRDKTYPFPEQIHFNRAMVYRHANQIEEALKELRRAVGLKPRYYRAHFEMAGLLTELRRNDEALLAFVAAEPGYTKDPEFHFRYGSALARSGDKSLAQRELRKAMELAPGSEIAAQAGELLGTLG